MEEEVENKKNFLNWGSIINKLFMIYYISL